MVRGKLLTTEGDIQRVRVGDAKGCGFGLTEQKAHAIIRWATFEEMLPLFKRKGSYQGFIRESDHSAENERA